MTAPDSDTSARHARPRGRGLLLAALAASTLAASSLSVAGCDRGQGSGPSGSAQPAPSAPLPRLGDIGQFKLTDHEGKETTRATLAGKVWVANFMFTRCPVICPRMTRQMRSIQATAKERDLKLHFVSFSVDPENDTPADLKEYATKHNADLKSWLFLTGDYEVVKRTSVSGFKMALEGKADENADHFGIIHGSHLVLVDSTGQIRGFYRSSDEETVERLLTDVRGLS